jgi:hypothetical protein
VNPSEQGAPAWTPPTGPDLSQGGTAQSFFQSPCFWLIAAAVVLYVVSTSEGKESEID